MKTRFWQRIYFLTLILFLLFLNIAVFCFAYYTYGEKVSACEETLSAEQRYIVSSIERDMEELEKEGLTENVPLLFQSYLSHYGQKGTALAFYEEEGEVPVSAAPLFEKLTDREKAGTLSHKRIGGVRYLLIVSPLFKGRYELHFLKDASEVDGDLKSLIFTFVPLSAGLSLLLALILFFLMRGMSKPLEELKMVTEHYAAGETSVRARVKGKDEFAALQDSFNGMLATIEEQMHGLEEQSEKNKRLVDDMAHEIRTPLTVIRGYAEVIARAAVDEETKLESAERIIEESKRLSGISEKILEMAVLEKDGVKRERIKTAKLLEEAKESLTPFAEGRGVTLRCRTEDCFCQGDPTLLSMLLYNLTENAVKACSEGGQVILACVKTEDGVVVTVSDNGKGMTKEQLERITEPFYRTDKARSRRDGGAGLGLSLCSSIAQSHGGSLTFTSLPGQGTRVSVLLKTRLDGEGEDQ